ncbi:MAG: head completion/stabilization protein, partial [Robiginitomaculum sp.]|nr:head completion/stabilization protein [Robiginitomaculum sp.]
TWALYAGIEDIPAEQVSGTSRYVHQYMAAVFNEAKADLVERYRDFDSTNDGHDEADTLEETIDDYRRKSRENIRALLGRPRATIELL